jgi:hypothetical protein
VVCLTEKKNKNTVLPFLVTPCTSVPCYSFFSEISIRLSRKFTPFSESWCSVLYQESEIRRNLLFDCFIIFVRKGVGLPISMNFFLEAKSQQENYCFSLSSIKTVKNFISHDAKSQGRRHTRTTKNTQLKSREMWSTALRQKPKSKWSGSSRGLANFVARNVTRPLRPATLHRVVSLLNAPARTSGLC